MSPDTTRPGAHTPEAGACAPGLGSIRPDKDAMRPVLLLLLAALAAAAAADGAAVLLDGGERAGPVVFTADGLTVAGAAVALADCDRIRLGGGGAPALATARLGLWLADGGWLPIERIEAAAGADQVAVRGPLGALVLPLSAVRGWGETLPAGGERDQVVVASGAYAGRIDGIADGRLRFASEGLGELQLPLGDVLGLRIAGADRAPRGLHLALAIDAAHPPLLLLPGPRPRLAAAPEAELAAWPASCELRVEGGRRVHLSQLDPASVQEEGAFGVTWKHRRDANLEGGPIRLDGRTWARGLSLHSQCELGWALDGRYERLRALVGIAEEVGGEGDCTVVISGDGTPLWKTDRLVGGARAVAVDVPLTGVKTLTIAVGFGGRYDIGDRVTLADAYLVKAKK